MQGKPKTGEDETRAVAKVRRITERYKRACRRKVNAVLLIRQSENNSKKEARRNQHEKIITIGETQERAFC